MPGEECCISDPVPLCHLNHCRFLMPWALLYKAQTAAGFSTLLLWNWINTMPVRVFTVVSQHPERPAHTGRRPPVSFCSLLRGRDREATMWHVMQNSSIQDYLCLRCTSQGSRFFGFVLYTVMFALYRTKAGQTYFFSHQSTFMTYKQHVTKLLR